MNCIKLHLNMGHCLNLTFTKKKKKINLKITVHYRVDSFLNVCVNCIHLFKKHTYDKI